MQDSKDKSKLLKNDKTWPLKAADLCMHTMIFHLYPVEVLYEAGFSALSQNKQHTTTLHKGHPYKHWKEWIHMKIKWHHCVFLKCYKFLSNDSFLNKFSNMFEQSRPSCPYVTKTNQLDYHYGDQEMATAGGHCERWLWVTYLFQYNNWFFKQKYK